MSNEQTRMTTLGHIIDRVRRSDALDNEKLSKETTETAYQRGYTDGFLEGKKQGFQDGIAWIKGK